MSNLQEIWDALNLGGESDQFVRLRLPDVKPCGVYAARRVGDGHEALILEVSSAAVAPRTQYPRGVGFDVHAESLGPGRSSRTRLLLLLTDDRYHDVFRSLAQDVLGSIADATDEAGAVRAFVARLTRWQAFLRQHGPEGLSLEARRGLFGEVGFLRDCIMPATDPATAVHAWKGSSGAAHDFQLPGGSIEVKTTSTFPPRTFQVSSLRQLDPAGVTSLFLCLTSVIEEEAADESLPELVESVRALLAGPLLEEFEGLLLEAGYLRVHEAGYGTPKYTVHRRRLFHVREGFPRIDAGTVPEGVEEVRYVVNVPACSPYEVELDTAVSSASHP